MQKTITNPVITVSNYITGSTDYNLTSVLYAIASRTNVKVSVSAHTVETKGAIRSFLFGKDETIHYQVSGPKENIKQFENLLRETARKVTQENTYVTHKGSLEGLSSLKLKQKLEDIASNYFLTITIKSKRRPSTHFFSERIVTCNYEVHGRFGEMRKFHDAIQLLERSLKK